MEQSQRDFGLEEFIKKHQLRVSEETSGRHRKLVLTVSEQTPHRSFNIMSLDTREPVATTFYYICNTGYVNPSVDVILSGNHLVGAKLRGGTIDQIVHLISISGEQIRGYYVSPTAVYVGIRRNWTNHLDFGQFLFTGQGTHINRNDVHVAYRTRNEEEMLLYGKAKEVIPSSFCFGPSTGTIFYSDGTYGFDPWSSDHRFKISLDEGYFNASRSVGNSTIHARFPEIITQAQLRELESFVNSEIGALLELSKKVSILKCHTTVPLNTLTKSEK